jgi:uncharacterized membrane protein
MSEQVTRSIIVGVDAATAFSLWAQFENFPAFMQHIRSVTRTGKDTSHWVARGAMGREVEWDAHTTRLEPNKRIAWNSTPDSEVRTSGQVTFNELSPQQTEVTVMMQYVLPAGVLGEALADLVADPSGRLEQDLWRFKVFAEGRPGVTEAGLP